MSDGLTPERIEAIRERFELVRNSLSGPAEATLSRDALDLLSALSQSQAEVERLRNAIEKHRDSFGVYAQYAGDHEKALWSALDS